MREPCSWDVPDDSEFDDLRDLMEDSPVSDNHGRSTAWIDEADTTRSLEPTPVGFVTRHNLADAKYKAEGKDILQTIPSGEESFHGLVAHRGVLSERESELLDWDKVDRLVTESLGVSVEEMERLYSSTPGRPTKALVAERAKIDARFLSIQGAGGNMAVLAACLGWPLDAEGKCWKMKQALARARRDLEVK